MGNIATKLKLIIWLNWIFFDFPLTPKGERFRGKSIQ